ncbi:MAG TPA: TIGR03435 family protein [Acidobacteriaceae bacterium]|nr:TIGR03435 family protein [Acidobacteriaceae bacterium]
MLAASEWLTIALALLNTGQLLSQTPPAQPASFEVASVRVSPADHGYTSISPSGAERFTATNTPLKVLIELAFGVDGNQITGKFGWLDTACYDVQAKPPTDEGLSYEELRPFLQNLLATRFHLVAHRETRHVSGYSLVVAKGGPKLTAAKEASTGGYILPDGLRSPGASIKTLASMLATPAGRPVIDKTGLAGTYSIDLKYAPEGSPDSELPSMFAAIQEQLGLKLEPQKDVPLAMLVVDDVDKMPTPN